MSSVDPSAEQVIQSEIPDLPQVVPVKVETPVRVQELPSVISDMDRRSITNGEGPIRLFNADPRRKEVQIRTASGSGVLLIGTSSQKVSGSHGFRLPASNLLTIHGREEIWVAAETTDVELSWMYELWTE